MFLSEQRRLDESIARLRSSDIFLRPEFAKFSIICLPSITECLDRLEVTQTPSESLKLVSFALNAARLAVLDTHGCFIKP